MDQIVNALQNIGFDWRVAAANLVNFLVIFWILKRFAFRPLQRKIDERNARIEEGVEKAEQAEQELARAEETYQSKLEEGKREAREIVASAREQKEETISEAKREAQEQAQSILAEARREAERKQARMEQEVAERAVDLAVAGAEAVLREKVDKEKNEEIIRNAVTS